MCNFYVTTSRRERRERRRRASPSGSGSGSESEPGCARNEVGRRRHIRTRTAESCPDPGVDPADPAFGLPGAAPGLRVRRAESRRGAHDWLFARYPAACVSSNRNAPGSAGQRISESESRAGASSIADSAQTVRAKAAGNHSFCKVTLCFVSGRPRLRAGISRPCAPT
jgi:hypothetical protein